METVYVKATRREVKQALRRLPAIMSGSDAEAQPLVQAVMVRMGMALMGRIKAAFVVKARGGTDDCGLSWPKLSPKTIAYSRRHPGVLWPGAKRAPFTPSWMLTDKQRKRWWLLNAIGGAGFAWLTIKAEGGKTLIGEYGDTEVEILRDKGLLLNSLSPGLPGAVENQVFKVEPGSITVGTNRKWAAVHHNGSADGRIPQRRLWAEPRNWPDTWWQDLTEQMKGGMIEVALFLLQRLQ